jgi:hypothetical protein
LVFSVCVLCLWWFLIHFELAEIPPCSWLALQQWATVHHMCEREFYGKVLFSHNLHFIIQSIFFQNQNLLVYDDVLKNRIAICTENYLQGIYYETNNFHRCWYLYLFSILYTKLSTRY